MTVPAQDIVERLRSMPTCSCAGDGTESPNLYEQAADTISRLTADNEALAKEVQRLKAALAEAGESLDWAARRMKGNCSGSEVNAVMLAAGRTADARAALGDRP